MAKLDVNSVSDCAHGTASPALDVITRPVIMKQASRNRGYLVAALGSVCLSFLAAALAQLPAPLDRLNVYPSAVNLGAVSASETRQVTVSLQNDCSTVCRIVNVYSTCGCTSIRTTSQSIQPAEAAHLMLEFADRSGAGPFNVAVDVAYVKGDDPTVRWLHIPIIGTLTQ